MRVSRARWLAEELGPPLAGVAGLLAIWAVVAAVTDSAGIPSPSIVWSAFLDGMRDGTLPDAATKTLTFVMTPDAAVTAPTIVSLPPRLYPMGASVDCGGCTVTPSAGSVTLAKLPAGKLTIAVRPR